jgi:hypothetical protein
MQGNQGVLSNPKTWSLAFSKNFVVLGFTTLERRHETAILKMISFISMEDFKRTSGQQDCHHEISAI